MKNNASLVYNLFLMLGDFLALIAAFVGAFILRVSLSDVPIAHAVPARTYLSIFIVVLPFWILIFGLLGLYNNSIYERRFRELGRLFIGSFIGLLSVIFINFLSDKPLFPAKLVPIYGFGLGFIFLVIFRNLARLIRTELFGFRVGLNNVLIVGNTTMTAELVDLLHNSRRSGYNIIGVIGTKFALGDHTHVATFSDFKIALESVSEPVHTIIQTELYADESRNRDLLEYAQANHVAYRFVPGNTELFVGNLDVQLFRGSIPIIAVHQTALIGWGRLVKRIFDLVFSTLAIIIFSPLLLVVAICIKLADGGPVFLRQVRLTRFNHEFRVYKFRSMNRTYSGLNPEEAFTKMNRPDLLKKFRENGNFLEKDPRITGIGKFIRATSIDELPQLFNVFKGDISLVGPRALIPSDLSVYERRHTILSVKSGITGLAQVSGRNHISFDERRKLDIYYVQNWSFWMDLMIIIKTIRMVLTGSNAE
jgi:exopolysaccharide biosynthesis polyprenyl glycosylphosphotransferase